MVSKQALNTTAGRFVLGKKIPGRSSNCKLFSIDLGELNFVCTFVLFLGAPPERCGVEFRIHQPGLKGGKFFFFR
jgi:hypothetical protein